MSLLVGLVKRAIVLAVAIFYGVLRATLLLVGAVRFGPSAVLTCKKRSRPPACLEDPSLGAHGYAHLEVSTVPPQHLSYSTVMSE